MNFNYLINIFRDLAKLNNKQDHLLFVLEILSETMKLYLPSTYLFCNTQHANIKITLKIFLADL